MLLMLWRIKLALKHVRADNILLIDLTLRIFSGCSVVMRLSVARRCVALLPVAHVGLLRLLRRGVGHLLLRLRLISCSTHLITCITLHTRGCGTVVRHGYSQTVNRICSR